MYWKEKKKFVNHKKVQDQKYDIFKVHQAFTVMQGPNFRKENQKKGKRIELVCSNFYKRLFVTQRLENRKDKKSNQYNLVLKKIEITSLSVKFLYLFSKMINKSDVVHFLHKCKWRFAFFNQGCIWLIPIWNDYEIFPQWDQMILEPLYFSNALKRKKKVL